MDDLKHSISPEILYARLGSEAAPIIIDVRRDSDFADAGTLVADAFHRSPDHVQQWRTDLPSGRQIVTYCVHGREVSQGACGGLFAISLGLSANFPDDHEMLNGMVIYDALYTWCRSLQAETHNWPACVVGA